jgi:predicted RNase H-like nuclease (RuvC/YqgF family)
VTSSQVVVLFGGLLTTVISAGVAYFTVARKLSGKVNTTEASELWKESSSIREDYRERLRFSDEALRRLEERIQKLEESNDALLNENRQLRQRVDELQRENADLHAQINGIKRKVNGD